MKRPYDRIYDGTRALPAPNSNIMLSQRGHMTLIHNIISWNQPHKVLDGL